MQYKYYCFCTVIHNNWVYSVVNFEDCKLTSAAYPLGFDSLIRTSGGGYEHSHGVLKSTFQADHD